ncbi:MAG: BtpA/SgcQ family protein [Erysipelotrichaceae bacterium]
MRKTWLSEVIGTEKAAIGLVHMLPLPSDPMYDEKGGMEKVYQAARHDLIALQNGGVDAILFTNEFSFPYQKVVKREIIASMAMVIGRLKAEITLPYGANVISDPMASIELCAAIDGKFTRGTFSGAYATNLGVVSTAAGEYVRKRHTLGIDSLKMVHYALPESSASLGNLDIMTSVRSALFNDMPDALGVSGSVAGSKADMNLIRQIREEKPEVVLFATTGVNIDTIEETFELADAAFIATHFKVDGKFENPIDEERVRKFMTKMKRYRSA